MKQKSVQMKNQENHKVIYYNFNVCLNQETILLEKGEHEKKIVENDCSNEKRKEFTV